MLLKNHSILLHTNTNSTNIGLHTQRKQIHYFLRQLSFTTSNEKASYLSQQPAFLIDLSFQNLQNLLRRLSTTDQRCNHHFHFLLGSCSALTGISLSLLLLELLQRPGGDPKALVDLFQLLLAILNLFQEFLLLLQILFLDFQLFRNTLINAGLFHQRLAILASLGSGHDRLPFCIGTLAVNVLFYSIFHILDSFKRMDALHSAPSSFVFPSLLTLRR